jgi:hypothetical protein
MSEVDSGTKGENQAAQRHCDQRDNNATAWMENTRGSNQQSDNA